MKRSRFASLLFSAAMVFFFASCNNDDSEKKTTTDSSTVSDSNAAAVAPEPTTIITTPQGMMVVVHKVANFTKWKASYDDHDSMRLANGIHKYVVGRGVQDSNMVLVAVKVDDMDKAKAFAKDPSLKKAMQKGGVTGAPTISFFTTTFQDIADVSSPLRSRTTFTVKDWDTWQKVFEQNRQERIDNGLVVRAYGHDADDDKKVSLVTAIVDTAKANAYWKSDLLKQRRAASGVIGEPKRFIYRVVEVIR